MKKLLFFLGASLLISSCTSSRFDYQTAYKFSYINQPQQQKPPTEILEVPLVASAKSLTGLPPVQLPQEISVQPQLDSDATNFMESYENASKKEKRVIRKKVKEDFRTLRKEYKKAKQEAVAQDIVFNKKMYIGLVIFAAGLLVAILASGPVGAIGIIVGIGLIAWGFIEQA